MDVKLGTMHNFACKLRLARIMDRVSYSEWFRVLWQLVAILVGLETKLSKHSANVADR